MAIELVDAGASPRRQEVRGRSILGQAWLWAGWAYIGLLVLVAIAAQWVAPYSPIAQGLAPSLQGPSAAHLLGTDNLGRDVASRLIWGTRPALEGIGIAMLVTCVLGITWGTVAGLLGSWLDTLMMRIADILQAFPSIILAIALTAALGVNLRDAMIALGVAHSPGLARVVRAGVISVKEREFVKFARMSGRSHLSTALRHVLPNAFAPVLVQLVILSGLSLLAQTSLGFLGLGDPPPTPGWGDSMAQAYQYILAVPAATLAPGLTVAIAVLAIYRIGDDLGDRWLKGR